MMGSLRRLALMLCSLMLVVLPPPAMPAAAQPDLPLELGTCIGIGATPELYQQQKADPAFWELVRQHYTWVTPCHYLKMAVTQPQQGTFDFAEADWQIDWAVANGKKVRGHTLIWHIILPPWLTSRTWTKAELTAVMEMHVKTLVARYRGRVLVWDVVNEAFNDNGSYRQTIWYTTIGPEYLDLAFRFAREADPDVKLHLNDYGTEAVNTKSTAIHNWVRDARARGVPVDGVGLQMHVTDSRYPNPDSVGQNIGRLAQMGVEVDITEMDVGIRRYNGSELADQAEVYRRMAEVCRDRTACKRLITWGATDRYSWRAETWPLPWDGQLGPKPAWAAIQAVLTGP